jgi:hypothetical protein
MPGRAKRLTAPRPLEATLAVDMRIFAMSGRAAGVHRAPPVARNQPVQFPRSKHRSEIASRLRRGQHGATPYQSNVDHTVRRCMDVDARIYDASVA